MNYSQFIHGKTTGGRNYEIVALTADLAGRESELEKIAQKYRFWGSQPPVANPIAVGVFHYRDSLLLAQAMQARRRNGEPILDVQGRPFTQHRYVFIPPATLVGLSGRFWLLLNWIMEETRGIPVFDRVERDLRPLPVPRFGGDWYNRAEELDKLTRSLTLCDQQKRPVLLSALAALVNQKRVIFDAAATGDIFSEDLLEGVLLLLPATCRARISVAAGALDERVCTQASLMVKTNGTPTGPLAADLIWAKRANNQFFGAVEKTTFDSGYTSLLLPILAQPDSLNVLLRILDSVDAPQGDSHADPWQALNNGWLATRLIPVLPDPQERAKYWRSALKNLSPVEWKSILPTVLDETGMEIAWLELQKQAKRQPVTYAPLVFQLWQNFSSQYISYTLQQELPADLELAENLLRHGLLTHLGPEHRLDLFNLCLAVITFRSEQNRQQAVDLAHFVLKNGPFDGFTENFALQEAVLPARPDRAVLVDFFNTQMAPILPSLTPDVLVESRIYQGLSGQAPQIAELIKTVVSRQEQALEMLPELASTAKMSLSQRRDFYAACIVAWRPAYPAARPLLTDLVTQWIAAYTPEERPPITSLTKGITGWLDEHASAAVCPLLIVSGANFSFEDWEVLAEDLFPDPLGQASFMDHATVGQPVTTMTRRWLQAVADNSGAKANFEASYTWHNLQTDGPTWLAEAVPQLLGWQPVTLSALLPLLERLQSALNLSQPTLFRFLEALPRQGDDDLGLMLAAYLPQFAAGQANNLEEMPLWQMLNAQAPKVAQVYKVLAEGQKNPALDMFNQLKLNTALNEAPEYATAMTHWLQLCGKGNWLKGRLLETLVERWLIDHSTIDPILLTGLLRPDLAEKYAFSDWLALAKICWLPDYQSLWPLSGQPSLSARQRAQVLNVARACTVHYVTPAQAQALVVACQNWGLSESELAELVSCIPQKACNFSLLHPYLYINGSVITTNSHTFQNLLIMAMQLNPSDPVEQAQFKLFLTRLLTQQLQYADGVPFLTAWRQVVVDKKLYQQALTSAALELAPDHFSLLVQRAHQLRGQGARDLSQTLAAALDTYWTDQKRKLSG
jgi:hypothetical protein